MKLREARLAYQGGRYDEAGELLGRKDIRQFLPAKKLARDVAAKFLSRAEERFARGDTLAGWNDLSAAQGLGGQDSAVDRLRHEYNQRSLTEVERYLAAGEVAPALSRLAKLENKGLAGQEQRTLRQIATLVASAEGSARRGHFSDASTAIERAKMLARGGRMEITERLELIGRQMAQHADEFGRLTGDMHAALTSQQWSSVLSAAEAILSIAPDCATARQARQRAWKAVGMDVTRQYNGAKSPRPVPLALDNSKLGKPGRSTRPSVQSFENDTVTGEDHPHRLLLWIDAVGGYLVCLDDRIVLGQPAPERPIAVPILADLSRRHAVIRREGGAYVLEPVHKTLVDGRHATGPTMLADGQLIQLGDSVRLRFAKPHALSSTARLTMESHHKTEPSADGILLMADSCVLGPNNHCHVRTRHWSNDVILFRQADELVCRSAGEMTVDGAPVQGAAAVAPGARVEGEDFSFCIEHVEHV